MIATLIGATVPTSRGTKRGGYRVAVPITKKYRFTAIVGADPVASVALANNALGLAGFTKVTLTADGWGVAGRYRPVFGTLWGDIAVSITSDGNATVLVLDVTAAVDNLYTLAESPGSRMAGKFLDALASLAPVSSFVAYPSG